jgi:hypothetical protein
VAGAVRAGGEMPVRPLKRQGVAAQKNPLLDLFVISLLCINMASCIFSNSKTILLNPISLLKLIPLFLS